MNVGIHHPEHDGSPFPWWIDPPWTTNFQRGVDFIPKESLAADRLEIGEEMNVKKRDKGIPGEQ